MAAQISSSNTFRASRTADQAAGSRAIDLRYRGNRPVDAKSDIKEEGRRSLVPVSDGALRRAPLCQCYGCVCVER